MPSSLRFAAIVPHYNDTAHLREALASLAAQTVPLTEILVVDDGSTAEALEVVIRLAAPVPQVRVLIDTQHRGVVDALNRGIRESSADFIFLCSANDVYHSRMVEWSVAALAAFPHAGLVCGNASAWDEEKHRAAEDRVLPLPQVTAWLSPDALVAHHRRVGIVFNGAAAMRRTSVLAAGGLQPDLRWQSDWFISHLLAFESGCVYVPERFSTVRFEGRKSYSGGFLDWSQQKDVIRSIVRRLAAHPSAAPLFRRAALLPTYDLREIGILSAPDLRWFITPLLCWRMLVHSCAYWLKYVVPRSVLMYLRRFVRA